MEPKDMLKLEVGAGPAFPAPGAEWVALAAGVACLFLALWVHGQRVASTRAAVRNTLGLALLMLAVMELSVRSYEQMVAPSAYRLQSTLVWALTPNLRNASVGPDICPTISSTNEYGLRETEVAPARSPGTFRILCIGDSWTFGSGVLQDETWCKQLQRQLIVSHPGMRFEVVNGGQSGFSHFQGYHMLKMLLPLYQPDLVLVGGFNDISSSQMPALEASTRVPEAAHKLRKLRLYMLLRKHIAMHAGSPKLDVADKTVLGGRYLDAMAATLEQARTPGLFFYQAFEPAVADERPSARGWSRSFNPELAHVRERASIYKLAICSGVDVVSEHLMLANDPIHPNARGHQRIATALARALEDMRLVPAGPARSHP